MGMDCFTVFAILMGGSGDVYKIQHGVRDEGMCWVSAAAKTPFNAIFVRQALEDPW